MRALEVQWSRALSLVFKVALGAHWLFAMSEGGHISAKVYLQL